MNILYTLNDKFVPQVATAIASVCENNKKEKKINFYLFSLNVSKNNKKLMKSFVKKYNRNIEIIEIDNLSNFFNFNFDTLGWSNVILARILMGKILPDKIERILYLDGDIIVRSSLSDFYKTDLQGKTIGMSIEPTVDKKRKHDLGLDGYFYYNSGVLLVDLKRYREINAETKIIDFYKDHDGKLFAADQDAINGSMKDEIFTISMKYNFYNIFTQYSYGFLKKLVEPSIYLSKEVYIDACKNPTIIHFLGEERPWRIGNKHKYRKDYEKYLKLTPWKNYSFEKGWKIYFICWNTFNFITKPFPKLRYNIINSLIPKFMNYRKKQLKKNK